MTRFKDAVCQYCDKLRQFQGLLETGTRFRGPSPPERYTENTSEAPRWPGSALSSLLCNLTGSECSLRLTCLPFNSLKAFLRFECGLANIATNPGTFGAGTRFGGLLPLKGCPGNVLKAEGLFNFRARNLLYTIPRPGYYLRLPYMLSCPSTGTSKM